VHDALREQQRRTGNKEYVFCTGSGGPIDNDNFTNRIWYPLLRHLGLEKRRPYQTRHTCATLWLAAGENPEWVARQLGHVDTTMLFKTYSRFIPNLTRTDGSAFNSLVSGAISLTPAPQTPTPSLSASPVQQATP
ncbi:MAG: site-specific integrase, partial [Rhodanobacteraceae bacterium]